MTHIYRTDFRYSLADDDEQDAQAVIRFSVTPARGPTLEDPGHDAEVSIAKITLQPRNSLAFEAPQWVYAYADYSEALRAELLEHAASMDEYHREQAADARREELSLERFA